MVPTDVRWIFPLVSVFISSISAICLDPRPTRLLLCYQDDVTPQLNPCSCTHLVHQFTDIKSINDQSEFLKSGRKLKEKNPDLRLVASISGSADDLLKNRNVTAQKLAAALDHAQLDGLEFNVNWNNSLVQKQNLVDLIKIISSCWEKPFNSQPEDMVCPGKYSPYVDDVFYPNFLDRAMELCGNL